MSAFAARRRGGQGGGRGFDGGGGGGRGGRGRGSGRGGGNADVCNFCGEPGHWKNQCPKLGNNKPNTQQSSPAAGSSKLAGSANSFTPSAAPSPPYNSEVYTNFLGIEKLPSKVYVYEITFVKETDADGDPVLITRKFEKKGLFENDLKQRHAYVRLSMASVNFWVTDYTNIWSTRPLFDNDNETFVPPPVTNLTGINPYTRRTVTAESASIHFDRAIDCQQTLEHDPGNTTGNDVSAKLLERGLNAMFTAQAQRTAQQTPTNANPALKQFGANKFYKTEEAAKFDLDNSEQVKGFLGYFISVRPGAQQYFLNVSLRCSPFLVQGLQMDNVIANIRGGAAKATSMLKGIRVQLQRSSHLRQNHVFGGIEFIASVKDPLSTGSVDIGTPENETLVRSNHLKTSDDSPYRQPLSSDQTSEMIKYALKNPNQHKDILERFAIDDLGLSDTGFQNTLANAFNLALRTDLQIVPCRFLKAPTVLYHGQIAAATQDAGWNLIRVKVIQPRTHSEVIVLDLSQLTGNANYRTRPLAQGFEKGLQQALKQLAIPAHVQVRVGPRFLTTQNFSEDDLHKELQQLLTSDERAKLDTAFIIVLPQRSYNMYSTIKRVAELRMGVQTVCVASPANDNIQYCSNIALKLNLKGKGSNHCIDARSLHELFRPSSNAKASGKTQCDTIVIGADVTHPLGHCATGCPSVAAVVGSVDDNFARFPGSMRLQNGRQEMITDLADMIMERLVDWANEHNGRLPGCMLFYRDGVSESQYQSVIDVEIAQLQQAYQMARDVVTGSVTNGEVKFKLTFIVVGKRHHARFFPKPETDMINNSSGKYGNANVKPGLVVDQVITNKKYPNFYLQSHNPIKGTGKSAHYVVLKNSMELSLDRIEHITHAFCYNYARATKGVSYCGPAYYADRLCDRGRAYISDWLIGRDSSRFGPDRAKRRDEKHQDYQAHVARYLSDRPYYRPDRTTVKYGRPRRNPWHPNLDDVMFYL